MATFLYRLGRLAVGHRRLFLLGWLVVFLGLGTAAATLSGTFTSALTIPGTPAQAALDELNEKIPGSGDATGRIVFVAPEGKTLADPAYQQAIGTVVQQVSGLPGVTAVIDPQTARAVSPDQRVGFATASFRGQLTEIPVETQDEIKTIADANQVDGLQIFRGGGAVPQTPAIGSTEGLGVIIAMVVLLITFGSVVAAGLPMLTALIGVGTGVSGILWASSAIEMSNTAPILALMLGLAVGIDYALFIVSRHRAQVKAGMAVEESIARANGTAGSAVVFAGLTVLIALAGLSVVGIPFLTIMGVAAAGTVAVAVLIAITLLPALLGFAGEKILPRKQRAAAAQVRAGADAQALGTVEHHEPNRWIRSIVRKPALFLVTGVVAMGVLAIPVSSLQLGLPDDGVAAPDTTQRQAYDAVTGSFGAGFNGPLLVSVALDPGTDPASMQQALGGLAQSLPRDNPDIAYVAPAGVSPDGSYGLLTVIPKSGPSDEATVNLVHSLRDQAGTVGGQFGATLKVTGLTAVAIDVSDKLADALPVYLLIVVGLALVLLLLVFRSIVVPVIAAVGFLISIGVAFGAVVAVYQWGWLSAIFGVDTPAPIISFLPILLIGVLFGLAMDYQVFMVSGMREAYVHGADPKTAVVKGFANGSRVVTAAAIIMTSVFAGFILAPDTIIASIGFALGLGVLVDAFVVRMTLTPAIMLLLGKAAWYLPGWLAKILPNVDIEGEKLLAHLDADRSAAARQPALAGVGAGASGGSGGGGDDVAPARGAHARTQDTPVADGAVASGGSANGASANGASANGAAGNGAAHDLGSPSNGAPTNGAAGNGAAGDHDAAPVAVPADRPSRGGRHRAKE